MRVRERVRLHLKTKRTIDGVLLSKRGAYVTLGDVRVEDEHNQMQPAKGRVDVAKANIEFAQTGWAE